MSPIPKPLLKEILADPYYKVCARADDNCDGRITFEHCFIYCGRQIQELWAIIPLCWYHHLGAGLNKELNHYISLGRAMVLGVFGELQEKYPKFNWLQTFKYLGKKFKELK